jgi:hypothetical protein
MQEDDSEDEFGEAADEAATERSNTPPAGDWKEKAEKLRKATTDKVDAKIDEGRERAEEADKLAIARGVRAANSAEKSEAKNLQDATNNFDQLNSELNKLTETGKPEDAAVAAMIQTYLENCGVEDIHDEEGMTSSDLAEVTRRARVAQTAMKHAGNYAIHAGGALYDRRRLREHMQRVRLAREARKGRGPVKSALQVQER